MIVTKEDRYTHAHNCACVHTHIFPHSHSYITYIPQPIYCVWAGNTWHVVGQCIARSNPLAIEKSWWSVVGKSLNRITALQSITLIGAYLTGTFSFGQHISRLDHTPIDVSTTTWVVNLHCVYVYSSFPSCHLSFLYHEFSIFCFVPLGFENFHFLPSSFWNFIMCPYKI